MTTDQLLTDEDASWIKSYKAQVVRTYTSRFCEYDTRLDRWQPLIKRFTDAVEAVLRHGRHEFHAVYEAHNELCIAHAILSNPSPRFDRVEYEPALRGTAKSIDFRATTDTGLTVYVDVKTIKPKRQDRWEQYRRFVCQQLFPENVGVTLSKGWLGGELWHDMFAARGRMLEHVVSLERKIADAGLADVSTLVVLAFCGEGLSWYQDELEDFVSFYRSGHHRPDDRFSLAETKYIDDNSIVLNRTISQFACMHRSEDEIESEPLIWHVQPPSFDQ